MQLTANTEISAQITNKSKIYKSLDYVILYQALNFKLTKHNFEVHWTTSHNNHNNNKGIVDLLKKNVTQLSLIPKPILKVITHKTHEKNHLPKIAEFMDPNS